jgi:hypothetical protein
VPLAGAGALGLLARARAAALRGARAGQRRPAAALALTPAAAFPGPQQESKAEQARLRAAGATVAPLGAHLQGPARPKEMGVGPLRLWPGGLCVARSIGDLDCGALVVPLPHIKQLRLPAAGCRCAARRRGWPRLGCVVHAARAWRPGPSGRWRWQRRQRQRQQQPAQARPG